MNEVTIKYENNQMLVTSLQVARDFKKRHDNVLRDIEELKDILNFEEMFNLTNIPDTYNRDRKAYLINRNGFTLLAMGFTGKNAFDWKLKYIEAFNKMEARLNSPEFIMNRALKMSKQQCDALLLENQKLKPKALFADAVSASESSILVGDLAKILKQNGINIGANRLFAELRNNGYLIKRSGSDWNMPTQKSMDMGLFEIKEHTHIDSNGCNVTTKTPKVTGKGQVYFINKFLGDRS